jgi:hypothetical protein
MFGMAALRRLHHTGRRRGSGFDDGMDADGATKPNKPRRVDTLSNVVISANGMARSAPEADTFADIPCTSSYRALARSRLLGVLVQQARASGDLPDGLFDDWAVQSSCEKFFASPFGRNRNRATHIPCPQEGRIAIVTDVGCGMRWTRRVARRAAPTRTAKSCGPDAPTLVSSS